jgi:hypothetical protein
VAVADDDPGGANVEIVGSLTASGIDPALRRSIGEQPPRRRLSAALSPDELTLMIRSHRVIVIPNPYREGTT